MAVQSAHLTNTPLELAGHRGRASTRNLLQMRVEVGSGEAVLAVT